MNMTPGQNILSLYRRNGYECVPVDFSMCPTLQEKYRAVAGDAPLPEYFDYPEGFAESGVPGYDTSSWFAFVVPARTPREIIAKMYGDTASALAEPVVRKKLDDLGVIAVGSTPEELGAHFHEEMTKWAPVIRAANIKVSE